MFIGTKSKAGSSSTLRTSTFLEQQRWLKMPNLHTARYAHASVALNDHIYVCGGVDVTGSSTSSVERYNFATNDWTVIASMIEPRCHFAVVVLHSMLYAVGGSNESGVLRTVERYNPSTNSWQSLSGLTVPRLNLTCSVISNTLHVFGGFSDVGETSYISTIEQYNPSINEWSSMGSAVLTDPTGRVLDRTPCCQGVVVDDAVYFGHASCRYSPQSVSRRTKLNSRNIIRLEKLPNVPLSTIVAYTTVSVDKDIYVFGGRDTLSNMFRTSSFVYNLKDDVWRLKKDMPAALDRMSCVVHRQIIYVIGGCTPVDRHVSLSSSCYRYSITSNEWF